jgi:GH25 family lysozyme M1 (1,4-beta-N-acetylmuramidase)
MLLFRAVPLKTGVPALFSLFMAGGGVTVLAQRPLGVDVSHFQNSINWSNVQSSGVTFAWAKASQGLTFTDPYFTINEANARGAGVLIGAYHFADFTNNVGLTGAAQEAAHFWSVASNYIKGGGGNLMPMLDVEQDLSAANPPYTRATLSAWVNTWCSNLVSTAAASGVTIRPVVYTYTSYANQWLDSSVTNWPLWMAQYPASPDPQNGAPSSTFPWSSWTLWQYSSTGTVPGVSGDCDLDVFNGSSTSLGALVIGGLASPYFTSQPLNHRVADTGGSVSFSASAVGTLPLMYQWTLNGTAITGATNPTINLASVRTNDAGNYGLIVTNSSGGVTSSVVSLIVYPPQVTVFSDNFDTDSSANWQLNESSSDNSVAFAFDYSTLGIPSAPNSSAGTTRGLQMKANLVLGVVAALSLSPKSQAFAGDYRLHFDGWINVNGPFPGGGLGSTEFLTAGLGTTGGRVEWTGSGSTADGFYFSVDGDGGVIGSSTTSGDYCAYAGTTLQAPASGAYLAGTNTSAPSARDNANPYYITAFPVGQSAPALQQANYSQQTGALNAGTFGLSWHDVIVSRRGSSVDWAIDGIRIATITNATFTASNVFVGFWDPFASLSSNNVINFGLVDNLRVEVPAVAPLLTSQPQSQTVRLGTNVTLTASATGLPAPDFQWLLNGTNISGATNSSYMLSFVAATNVGTYSVFATNIAGSVTSTNALLALLPPAAAHFQNPVLQGGVVQIAFTGDPFWTYTIETSTNLTSWSVLTNLTSTNSVFQLNAGSVTNSPQQFYRALVNP